MSKRSITPEEEDLLAKELPKVLAQGANNHSKASFVKKIGKCVTGSTNPKFFSMQPQIKVRNNNNAWNSAYQVVFNYLNENFMELTLKVIDREFSCPKCKKEKPPKTNVDDIDFDNLIQLQPETVKEHLHNQNDKDNDNNSNDYGNSLAKPLNQSGGFLGFLTEPTPQNAAEPPSDLSFKSENGNNQADSDLNDIEFVDDSHSNDEKENEKSNNSDIEFVDDVHSNDEKENENSKDSANDISFNFNDEIKVSDEDTNETVEDNQTKKSNDDNIEFSMDFDDVQENEEAYNNEIKGNNNNTSFSQRDNADKADSNLMSDFSFGLSSGMFDINDSS